MPSISALRAAARNARRRFGCGPSSARVLTALVVVALWAGTAAADIVVNSSADDGSSGTLRWAINQANASPGSTIDFNLTPGSTINLTSPLPPIESNVTINGAGATGLKVDGGGANAAFFVDNGTVKIENLTIANTNAVGGAGGTGSGGGGGGLGAGGALFVNNTANVTIQNVTFQNNAATGGAGGAGAFSVNGGGGGGFHGAGGSGGTWSGGGGGGFVGAGGASGGTYGQGAGGGGEFGNGASPYYAGFTGGGGGGTNPGQNGAVGGGTTGGAGGGTSGGAGGDGGASGVAGTTGGGGGGAGTSGSGGNGGQYGGGGGSGIYNYNGSGGAGGDFGGGGGGGANSNPAIVNGGAGGFGGGGGGAGSSFAQQSSGGFGAGSGGASYVGGDGGSALGGAIFVRSGGSLTIIDSGLSGSSVTAGLGGSGPNASGANGSADGAGVYAMSGVTANVQIDSGSQTIGDPIGGAGGINKTGAGTLVLSGTNDYTGSTEVSAGLLSVNGSTTSNTTVDLGATLGGSGTINGDVINNGNVAPGDPTTLTVNGNYSQGSGGNLQIQINNAGTTPGVNSSLLVVNGTANLGGTVEVQPASGSYAIGTRYIFLEATSLSGNFSGITLDNQSSMHATLGYGDITVGGTLYADAYFTLANGGYFPAYAQTPNQLAVAAYIDAISANPNSGLQNLITTLDSLSPAGLRGALDQMSGALYGSVAQTDLQSTTLELSFITRRVAGGLGGADQSPTGLATNSYGDRINSSAGSLASNGFGSGLTVRGQSPYTLFRPRASNWTTWGFGYGLGGNAQGTSNAAGLNYSLGGTVVGLDMREENHLLGIYAGYVGSHLGSYLSGQSVGVNGGQFGTYLRGDDGLNYYVLLAGMGADGYNSRRLMQISGIDTTAAANYGGWQSQLYLERGVTLQGSKASIQPYAALQYLYVRQNNFTETGAGVMDLKVAGIDANSLRSLIGVRLAGYGWTTGGRSVTPVARALWLHEFLSTTTGLNAQFAPIGGTNFAVTGTSLGRDWAILGTGLNWNLGRGWQAYANYDAQVNVAQVFHVGSGGFQYSW
ncbi:MAG TPA: autotransporter domain-containing protein [Pirellulales bacterium]|jgi:outer membrane autotransporter protein